VYSVWESEDVTQGRLREQFVEQLELRNREMDRFISYNSDYNKDIPLAYVQNAPKYPDMGRVRRLFTITAFGRAVDEVIDVQQGMQEKWAWIEIVMGCSMAFPRQTTIS
jgi:hypothetical protein